MKSKKTFREEIAEDFVNSLEEDNLVWIKGWNGGTGAPLNFARDKEYKGINKLYLKKVEIENNFNDNRWLTFKQIVDNDYHLKKGSRGCKVEYFIPYDVENKKWVTWEEFEKNQNNKDKAYKIKPKYYTVFNASQIEGIEKLEQKYELNKIEKEEVIEKISKGMRVDIIEKEGNDRAYYDILSDKIVIPQRGQFKSREHYTATVLHELSHATGSENRLNRDIQNRFGTKKYGFEELVAEISSSFMSEYISDSLNEDVLSNHKAYVNSWVKNIKEDKNFLFKAIKEADKASEYMIEKGELREFVKEREKVNKEEIGKDLVKDIDNSEKEREEEVEF